MFCIAAFVVFVVLGIFSAKYRILAKKSWHCVAKKITFRPCDVGFKEEAKNILIGKLVFTKPRLAKFLDKWIEVFATVFVVLSVWSLVVVLQGGLNLFVYDTCSPKNVESCSLGGESCGISLGQQTFIEAVKNMDVLTWAKDEVLFFVDTLSRVPNRFKSWNPEEYIDERSTYYNTYDSQKQIALEIIDPGCNFCGKLFNNIKSVGFENKYNLTYIPYVILDPTTPSGFKFPNSSLVTSYLEAVKLNPIESITPADWQILEKLFLEKDNDGILHQEKFNFLYSKEEAESVLTSWLKDIGYTDSEISEIQNTSKSDLVRGIMEEQRRIVEEQIRTIKIPTIIFDGRRYDRVIGEEKLK
jgi:hypothetical protein